MPGKYPIDCETIEKILAVRNESLRRGACGILSRFLVNWQRKKILSRHKIGVRIVNGAKTVAEYTVWSSDGLYWDKYKRNVNEDEVWVVWTYELSYIEKAEQECEEIIEKELDEGSLKRIRREPEDQ